MLFWQRARAGSLAKLGYHYERGLALSASPLWLQLWSVVRVHSCRALDMPVATLTVRAWGGLDSYLCRDLAPALAVRADLPVGPLHSASWYAI